MQLLFWEMTDISEENGKTVIIPPSREKQF
jgi:hypothetical protein